MTRILLQQESCSIRRSRTRMEPCENAQRTFGSLVCSEAETFRVHYRLFGQNPVNGHSVRITDHPTETRRIG